MRKQLTHLSFILLLCATFSFADVAVIKTGGVAAFDEARNGFSSICFENEQEFDLLDDNSNQATVADSIKAGNFQLLVAIGSQAATFVKNNFPQSLLVFCLVVNPETLGLKGDNITGVALNVPIREQFTVLRSIDKKVKRLGVIYTRPGNEALIGTAKDIASEENFTLVTSPISSSQDIQKAMTDLVGRCDALWIPPDPSLNSKEIIRYIGTTSLSRQLPCVGPDDRYVRSGAIFTISEDAIEAGKVAGDLANKILQGASPSKLAVQELQKPKVIINLKAASLLGLTIPQDIQRSASKIYQ